MDKYITNKQDEPYDYYGTYTAVFQDADHDRFILSFSYEQDLPDNTIELSRDELQALANQIERALNA